MQKFRPFPTPPPDVAELFEARMPGSRTRMFGHVISAVDCACGEAEAEGDAGYVRYCHEELFPFLEAERNKAAEEEGCEPLLEWEKSLLTGEKLTVANARAGAPLRGSGLYISLTEALSLFNCESASAGTLRGRARASGWRAG